MSVNLVDFDLVVHQSPCCSSDSWVLPAPEHSGTSKTKWTQQSLTNQVNQTYYVCVSSCTKTLSTLYKGSLRTNINQFLCRYDWSLPRARSSSSRARWTSSTCWPSCLTSSASPSSTRRTWGSSQRSGESRSSSESCGFSGKTTDFHCQGLVHYPSIKGIQKNYRYTE